MKFPALFLALFYLTPSHAVEFPSCQINEATREVTGNYNAVQAQAYEPSCQFNLAAPGQSAPVLVVPIGNNKGGLASRIRYSSTASGNSIEMRLEGATDNTLSEGQRGRQEVASCFISTGDFLELPESEQQFRRMASDYYRDCTQRSGREVVYEFSLKLHDNLSEPTFQDWDSIVMQLHALNDKDIFCIPNPETPADQCNQHNGTLGRVERTPQAYEQQLQAGAIFEKDLQPPVSFRLKDGNFMIVITSSLVDANGAWSSFSPGKNCSLNLAKATVGQLKSCPETKKTIALLYRAPLGEAPLPLNEFIRFRVSVKWPATASFNYRLKVETIDPYTGQTTTLVDNDNALPFSSHDDLYPYFKAGVYRLNGNATPMTVTLKNLSITSP